MSATQKPESKEQGLKDAAQESPLPHERDQSTRAQGSPLHPVIKQAHDDIVTGKKDTDLHGTPGLDKPRK
jgi:hypothetical protein